MKLHWNSNTFSIVLNGVTIRGEIDGHNVECRCKCGHIHSAGFTYNFHMWIDLAAEYSTTKIEYNSGYVYDNWNSASTACEEYIDSLINWAKGIERNE